MIRNLFSLAFGVVALVAVISTINVVILFAKFISFQHDFESHDNYILHQDIPTDSKMEEWLRLGYNVLLLLSFVIQHSLMAHSSFKDLLQSLHLGVVERSIYAISTSIMLMVLISQWSRSEIMIWSIDTDSSTLLWLVFTVLHVTGWTLIIGTTLLMDAYELVGLKQVYYYSIGLESPLLNKSYGLQRLYRHMRHPGTCALTALLIVHPHMTVSRALLTLVMCVYTIMRFKVDKEDHSYMQQQMISKEDELSTLISSSYKEEQLSVTESWNKSFHRRHTSNPMDD